VQERKKKKVISVDTSGIEPDTFRRALEVRSERDKPTTPCAPYSLEHPMQSGPCQGEFRLSAALDTRRERRCCIQAQVSQYVLALPSPPCRCMSREP
jgi:hypothetical protein